MQVKGARLICLSFLAISGLLRTAVASYPDLEEEVSSFFDYSVGRSLSYSGKVRVGPFGEFNFVDDNRESSFSSEKFEVNEFLSKIFGERTRFLAFLLGTNQNIWSHAGGFQQSSCWEIGAAEEWRYRILVERKIYAIGIFGNPNRFKEFRSSASSDGVLLFICLVGDHDPLKPLFEKQDSSAAPERIGSAP